MPKACSNDLRLCAAAAMKSGETCRAAAAGFDIAPSTAVKRFRRFRQSGLTAPAKIGGHLAPALAPHDSWVRDQVRKRPGITVRELAHRADESLGIAVCRNAVWRFPGRCGPSSGK